MARQPKKNITKVSLTPNLEVGKARRISYGRTIVKNAPIFPKPLEYEDIDKSFYEFVENQINLVVDGKRVPTYTLYSSQRFSEYSQTWSHTDDDGNLLMNFKTVIRENNPSFGDNQGGLWNIPGERRYTILMREVMEDNGSDCYEIYSMKQPFPVDLSYRVNFITDKFENLNKFNIILNDLFKARQCYIRPNGHFLPMVVDEVNDETPYGIEDRKFFVQSTTIKVMAYIIKESDFQVEKRPKRINLAMGGEKKKKYMVNIEEFEKEELENVALELSIDFESYQDKAEFVMDTDMRITDIEDDNVRNLRVFVNDTMIYYEKGFNIKNGDKVRLKITRYDQEDKSSIVFSGYNPNEFFKKDYVPESVSDEAKKFERRE